jgi:hypothetical protein
VPPSTLPTPISNGSEGLEGADPESSRSLPRPTDSRVDDSRLKDPRLSDARLNQRADR